VPIRAHPRSKWLAVTHRFVRAPKNKEKMRNIKAFILTGIAVIAMPAMGLAEIPKELKGTWVLDIAPTIKHMKTSPGWNDQTEKDLPPIMKRMSQVMFEFTDDSLVLSVRGKKNTIPVSLKSTQSNVYIFERNVGEKQSILTVSITKGTNIIFRSPTNNELDSCLWKRGRLTKAQGPRDEALALELAMTGNKKPSDKPAAQWMSGMWGIGWRVYAGDNKYVRRFQVNRLVEQVKTIPNMSYVLFNLSQGASGDAYTAPHSVLSKINPGSCSQRDLFGEMATAFQAEGYKVLAYMATEGPAKLKHGTNNGRGSQGVENWKAWVKEHYGSSDEASLKKAYAEVIVREFAQRYGTKIDGWWFDHASFGNIDLIHREITQANPTVIVAFNWGELGITANSNPDYEDYTFGHPIPLRRVPANSPNNLPMVTSIEATEDGFVSRDGKPSLGHLFMPMKNRWNSGKDVVWPEAQAVDWMQRVLQAGGAWTWNVPFNDKTSQLDPAAVDFAKRVGSQLR
jgi:hypothetical protein